MNFRHVSTLFLVCSFLLITESKSTPVSGANEIDIKNKIGLTDKEIAWIEQHNLVNVAVRTGWMPIEFKLANELSRGVSLDYLDEIAHLTGLSFNPIEYSGDSIDVSKVQLISGVIGKVQIDHYTVITNPHLVIPFALYQKESKNFNINNSTLNNLANNKVAIYKNASIAAELKLKYPNLELVYVDIADEAFEYLKNNQIDAYIGNEIVIDYHIEFHRLRFVEKTDVTSFNSKVRMAVRNDERVLHSIITKALKYIGTNNPKIINKWKAPSQQINYISKVLISLLLLVLLAVSFRLFLDRKKAKLESLVNQKKIWHQANYDLQTGLPNRNFYVNKINELINESKKDRYYFALLFIDIDDFKNINDTSGHSIGDKLLKEFGDRLTTCLRDIDFCARVGGDEFVILIKHISDFSTLDDICHKILNTIRLPFRIEQLDFFVSASIGISKYSVDSIKAEELLSYADQAMYEAKKQGRNRHIYFSKHMQDSLTEKINIANDLRVALHSNQFEMLYQPIVCTNTLKIFKVEALIRWNHPDKGLITPNQFITIAEETGMIHQLGSWILSQVIKDMVSWRQCTTKDDLPLYVSINISPLQFSQPHYLDAFLLALDNNKILPSTICFEITEGLLLHPSETVINTIKSLKSEGIKFSIDDFGTGYSAIAYLKKFDIDFVKIDKSFINNLDTDNYNKVLCESIIFMSHKLNIRLIAEGVEHKIQEDILRELKCDFIQGFLHGKPMTLKSLMDKSLLTQ